MGERVKELSKPIRFTAATTLFLMDSFLLSQPRNIKTMYQERGFVEGTKASLPAVLLPLAASTLMFAATKRIDISLAAGLTVYLLEGILCDLQEFSFAMRGSENVKKRWLDPLIEKIYPENNSNN